MIDDNDSFEEEPVTRNEMIQCGRNIGATHALLCMDAGNPNIYVSYVMPGECAETIKEKCLGGCPSVEIIDISLYEALE